MRQMRHQQKEKPVRKACLMTCSRFPDKGQRRNRYAHGKSPELYRDVPYTNGIASWPIDTRTVATASPWIRYFLCSSVLVGVLLVCNLNHPGKRDASYECCVSIGVLSAFSCPSQVLVAITATFGPGQSGQSRASGGGCSPLVSMAGIITDMTPSRGCGLGICGGGSVLVM